MGRYRAYVKQILALTGTPAPNTLMDLFAQVRFVDGGHRLGRAFDLFKQTYFRPTGYQGYQWKELPGSQEKIEQRSEIDTGTFAEKGLHIFGGNEVFVGIIGTGHEFEQGGEEEAVADHVT